MTDHLFTCKQCEKKYSNKSNLFRHARKYHQSIESNRKSPMRCRELECSFGCQTMQKLIEHLSEVHGMSLEYQSYNFESEEKFLDWKLRTEEHYSSSYIQISGKRRKGTGTRKYFYCHRTGHFKMKGQRRRKLRQTVRMGGHCTSHMVLEVNERGLVVRFCRMHYGHTTYVQHLDLSPKEKRLATQKNLTFQQALNALQDILEPGYQRVQNLIRDDLRDIESVSFNPFQMAFPIHGESLAIKMWVESMALLGEDNPVRLYKPAGAENPDLGLEVKDLVLVVTSRMQAQVICSLNKDATLCLDVTHNADQSCCILVTAMTINESSQAVPLSFLITNRLDYTVTTLFVQSLMSSTGGKVKMKEIMTRSKECPFARAWDKVMGKTEVLVIPWEVDKSWREKLGELEQDRPIKMAVYKKLRALLNESCILRFQTLWEETLAQLAQAKGLGTFHQYLVEHYSDNSPSWAVCFRTPEQLNLHEKLEALHEVLKVIYIKGQETKRPDLALTAFLRLFRDREFSQMLAQLQGRHEEMVCKMGEEHLKRGQMTAEIKTVNPRVWCLAPYALELVLEHCSCTLRCPHCRICLHLYRCTCPEGLIKPGICPHVHYLIKRLGEVTPLPLGDIPPCISHAEDPEVDPEVDGEFPDLQKQIDTLENLQKADTKTLSQVHDLIVAVQGSRPLDGLHATLREVATILTDSEDQETNSSPEGVTTMATVSEASLALASLIQDITVECQDNGNLQHLSDELIWPKNRAEPMQDTNQLALALWENGRVECDNN